MHLVLPGITKVLLVRSLEGVAVAPVSLTFRADSLHSTLKVSSEDRDADTPDNYQPLTHLVFGGKFKSKKPPIPESRSPKTTADVVGRFFFFPETKRVF